MKRTYFVTRQRDKFKSAAVSQLRQAAATRKDIQVDQWAGFRQQMAAAEAELPEQPWWVMN